MHVSTQLGRAALAALGLTLLACGAESTEPECGSAADCPADHACVDGVCEPRPGTDAGGGMDAGGPPDSGTPDAGTDPPTPDAGDGTDAGSVPIEARICSACESDADCGGEPLVCVPLTTGSGERACLERCGGEFRMCSYRGFLCVSFDGLELGSQVCAPQGVPCCLDEDADEHGIGIGCRGPDCDDTAGAVNPTELELCNGIDDNCNGVVDECVRESAEPSDFSTGDGAIGAVYDAEAGGLVLEAEATSVTYLWVPNTAESTLSKWDPTTLSEVGRYRVGLVAGECPGTCCWSAGCNMPSRVVVDGQGDVYVANRGFGMQGTVTKIASDESRCVDRDASGTIETSRGNVPMDWDTDECVLWTVNVGPVDAVLRALAVDRGDALFPAGYPWVGGYNVRRFYKLDPDTGATLDEVDVGPLTPYGAIVLADGRLFMSTLDTQVGSFDTTAADPTLTVHPFPASRGACTNNYGITADPRGRVWYAGWGCQDALGYDPATDQWTRVAGAFGITTGRGITVDPDGRVWMPMGGDGQATLTNWDMDAFVPGGDIPASAVLRVPVPAGHQGPSGVGVDSDGYLWLAHHVTSQLVRVDRATNRMVSVAGPNRVYTYSDFTGSVRRSVIGTGSYVQLFDTQCSAPSYQDLVFDADVPAETSLSFSVRTANTISDLSSAPPVDLGTVPPGSSPIDIAAALAAAGASPGRYMRLTTTLSGSPMARSPVVRSYDLGFDCELVNIIE